jgi:carbon starvation protein
LLQDVLGNLWKPLGQTSNLRANVLASVLIVSAWGYFLIQGVLDPLGGINSLWPLFGIANQLLAAIALCLATTIILKMGLHRGVQPKMTAPSDGSSLGGKLALVTLLPLVWLLAVTMTAGVQKIFHSDPRIGFLAQARDLAGKQAALAAALTKANTLGNSQTIDAAEKALRTNRVQHFNNLLDAVVAGTFLVLVITLVLLSAREWILLLLRKKLAELKESPAVWLPDYALEESKPIPAAGALALVLALGRELSGEAHLERARCEAQTCSCNLADKEASGNSSSRTDAQIYVEVTERRFSQVNRCC